MKTVSKRLRTEKRWDEKAHQPPNRAEVRVVGLDLRREHAVSPQGLRRASTCTLLPTRATM